MDMRVCALNFAVHLAVRGVHIVCTLSEWHIETASGRAACFSFHLELFTLAPPHQQLSRPRIDTLFGRVERYSVGWLFGTHLRARTGARTDFRCGKGVCGKLHTRLGRADFRTDKILLP